MEVQPRIAEALVAFLRAALVAVSYKPSSSAAAAATQAVPFSGFGATLLDVDVLKDVAARLRYYETAREQRLSHVGAVFVAEDDETGEILGFSDVGLTLYDTRKRSFRLPKRPDGTGPDLNDAGAGGANSHLWPRFYLSNLAVEASARRRGVGRLLVEACEAEALRWGGHRVELSVLGRRRLNDGAG